MGFFDKSKKQPTLLIILVGIFATIFIYFEVYPRLLSDYHKSTGQRLQSIATGASSLIDSGDHKKVYSYWLKSAMQRPGSLSIKEIEQTDEFKRIQKTLRDIKNVNKLQQDIYTVVLPKFLRKQNEMVFMTMSKEKPYIGKSLPISEIALKVLESKTPSYSDIYVDHEGTWISALAPIIYTYTKGKKKGKTKVVGLIEVDYDVTEEVHAVQMNLLKKSFFGAAIILILLCFSSLNRYLIHRP